MCPWMQQPGGPLDVLSLLDCCCCAQPKEKAPTSGVSYDQSRDTVMTRPGGDKRQKETMLWDIYLSYREELKRVDYLLTVYN